jgi:hypothetical protein
LTKIAKLPSLEQGLRQAFQAIGEGGVEDAIETFLGVRRSSSLIRKCADPDDDQHNVQQRYAVAIDIACVRAGHLPPMLGAHQHLLEQYATPSGQQEDREKDLSSAVLRVQAALGTLAKRVIDAQDPDSPAGRDLSESERHGIFEALCLLEEDIARIERSLVVD